MPTRCTLFVCLTLLAAPAWGSVQEQRPPTLGAKSRAPYTQAVQVLPSGTRVVHYIDRRGIVFAVAWSGPYLPELQAMLGQHYLALVDAQSRSSLHAPIVVRTRDVVIASGGGAGAFTGRAWLPGRLPASFDPRDLP
ncbi:DUF2844 domain-containing protein [Ramlibacter algicola]|uniref:DUF2844 domain-containing protein n=1 Tax=Ramlibacter algicola TaxID=2795217 RepID=A0A934PZK6_9BURK|nr:DUF2844 domain-containing protein [Ramlibacter algicola]MBK0391998.1 DUF2844 domain-containing protein [Ramlibacter algicola]